MADDRQEVAEAARTVVEAVAEAEIETSAAEAAIEAAEARAEAAEEIAEQLADAALRDRLGQMVAEMRQELDEWRATHRNEMEMLQQDNASLKTRVANLTTDLEALKANSPSPQVAEAIQVSSSPDSLAEVVAETAEVIAPDSAATPEESAVLIVNAKPRRARFI